MRVRGHRVLDSETWGRLCAILMGIIVATVVLLAANKASLGIRSRQVILPSQGIISARDKSDTVTEAGSTEQLAQLAHQVSLLEKKIHATRIQQHQHAKASDKATQADVQQQRQWLRATEILQVIAAKNTSVALVEAGRSLRKEVQTAVTVDGSVPSEVVLNGSRAGETWFDCLSSSSNMPQQPLSGSAKWAMAPFLAHQAMNETGYKWMLFGSDSTVLFPKAALQLLEDFDDDLPYIITDDLIWRNASGAAMPDEAPRCLPCHFDDVNELLRLSEGTLVVQSGDPTGAGIQHTWGLGLPKGCPCTPELVCQARPHLYGNPHGCSKPDFPVQQAYSMNGSSGLILSAALLRSINVSDMKACIQSVLWPKADGPAMLLECLWHFGYAVTDPGIAAFRPSVRLFDPLRGAATYEIPNRLKWDVAPEDTCDLQCQDLVHFMISTHVGGDDAKEVAASVKRLASKWLWWWEAQKPDHAPTTLYWTFD